MHLLVTTLQPCTQYFYPCHTCLSTCLSPTYYIVSYCYIHCATYVHFVLLGAESRLSTVVDKILIRRSQMSCTGITYCALSILKCHRVNKNLAIANRWRVSCAHNTLRGHAGIYRHKYYTVTLKSRLRITQGHWKRNHWTDHTRLSSIVELFDVEYYCDLQMWVRGH